MNSTPETEPHADSEEVEAPAAESVEPVADSEPVEAPAADPALLDARDLALAALYEVTPAATVGDPADYRVEADGVVSLRFHNRMAGYPGWLWTVSLARLEDAEPTVLEIELLPDDGALLAPDWVPWAERLADYQAAQVALAELAQSEVDDADDDLDDVDDLDAADFDQDGSSILHAGDVDGVDIDELDVDADDEDFVEESDESDEESDEDADEDDDEDDFVEDDADELAEGSED